MGISPITPPAMVKIIDLYNNAPHKTLSKLIGFEVSPSMVQNDKALESEIIRQIDIENDHIKNNIGFILDVGSKVYIYNSKDGLNKRRSMIKPYIGIIKGFNGVVYEVEYNSITQQYPRSLLKPAFDP